MKRTIFVLLSFAILGSSILGNGASRTFAESGSDQKAVTPDVVLAGLKQAADKVRNFSVKIHWIKYFGLAQLDKPVKTQSDTSYIADGLRQGGRGGILARHSAQSERLSMV